MQLSIGGVDSIIKRLESLKNGIETKQRDFLERLAQIGVETASVSFQRAEYDGDNDVQVASEWIDDSTIAVRASGTSVLFIEFGSGVNGAGHEQASEFGYGPGTWSDSEQGKGHWQDPNGWYYKHGEKSHGNPPSRSMYEASKEMRQRILEVAREVFMS